MQPKIGISSTICIGWESWCLSYAGFLINKFNNLQHYQYNIFNPIIGYVITNLKQIYNYKPKTNIYQIHNLYFVVYNLQEIQKKWVPKIWCATVIYI